MNFSPDPVNIVNIILCTIIIIMGFIAYSKKKNAVPMLIAIAFLLFDIAHIIVLLGMHDSLEITLIVIRTAGYLIVIDAMYHSLKLAAR